MAQVGMRRAEYAALHHDYRTRINGQPYALRLDPGTGATVLVPVWVTDADRSRRCGQASPRRETP
jgi:hypothetical protein